MQLIEQATNDPIKRRVLLHLVDATDGITPETGEAGTKCKISLNYAAPADSANGLVAFDTVNAPGDYYLELTASEVKDPGMLVVRYKSANTAHFVQEAQVVAFNPDTWRGPLVGSPGPDIDYKRIQKLIAEAVNSIPAPQEAPVVDLKPVLAAIRAVHVELAALQFPQPETVNLAPLMMAVKDAEHSLSNQIKAIEMPETDLNPVLEKVEAMQPQNADILAKTESVLSKIQKFFVDDVDEIKASVEKLNSKFDEMPYVVIEKRKTDDESIQGE